MSRCKSRSDSYSHVGEAAMLSRRLPASPLCHRSSGTTCRTAARSKPAGGTRCTCPSCAPSDRYAKRCHTRCIGRPTSLPCRPGISASVNRRRRASTYYMYMVVGLSKRP